MHPLDERRFLPGERQENVVYRTEKEKAGKTQRSAAHAPEVCAACSYLIEKRGRQTNERLKSRSLGGLPDGP